MCINQHILVDFVVGLCNVEYVLDVESSSHRVYIYLGIREIISDNVDKQVII